MKLTVAIIGGGPSSLLLASFLDESKFDITIYEKNKSCGRKFLVAGDGGFNLTHSESIGEMIERYTPVEFLKNALLSFTNDDLRAWLEKIGIETFVGSSNRVYPIDGTKPIEVLNAILKHLKNKGVHFKYEHDWTGWNADGSLSFENSDSVKADKVIYALGGGSWSVTGSDGAWLPVFSDNSIETTPFNPANCAYKVEWQKGFVNKHEGKPLKNIVISCFGKSQKGEAVVTQFGLEGNAIYGLSPQIQELLDKKGEATVLIDLKPTIELDVLLDKMKKARVKKTTEVLRRYVKLSPTKLDLVKYTLERAEYVDLDILAKRLKALPVTIKAAATLDEAISTSGGIELSQVDSNFELKGKENSYAIGEMLDWNAPTGGYLLQASFSMGHFLAMHLNNSVESK